MARVKICSFPRSGTHLLMASIYHNFDIGTGHERVVTVRNQQWSGTGTEQAVVPWAGLFGSHLALENAHKLERKQIIYIYRNPINCLYSNWRFFGGEDTTFSQWLTPINILHWQQHVESYFENCHTIKYEDLRDHPEIVLELIQKIFKLKRRNLEGWIIVRKPVGWTPRKKFEDHVLSDDDREAILEALDPKFMEAIGYG